MGQCVEGVMDSQRGCNQIDKWRLVANLSVAEEFGAGDVSATAVRLDPLPVVGSLQDMLARF